MSFEVVTAAAPHLVRGLAALAAAATAAGCLRAAKAFRGTTLAGPVYWAAAGAAAVALVEAWLAWAGGDEVTRAASAARYIAAVGTWCAPMAVLGAKRPQDRGWQWIVASLWLILALPALQTLAFRSGERVELSGLWAFFTLGLALYGTALNYAATRFALPALLLLVAQIGFIAPAAPWWNVPAEKPDAAALASCLLLAASLCAAQIRGRRLPEGFASLDPASASPRSRWLAFRDAFGLSWGLRIMARVNETARLAQWPVRLGWQGFVHIESSGQTTRPALDSELPAAVDATMDALLRRFERQT